MKLTPFAEFALHERHAVVAMLQRLGIPPRHICVSRAGPAERGDDVPTVVLVSAPGWSRAYEGADWIARLEQDLEPFAQGEPSAPAPLEA
jgi:hypothetical protein